MDKKSVIAGIMVIIIGLVVSLYGIYLVQGVEANYDDSTMTISNDANLTYQIGHIAEISGILLFLIGMCLIIVWGIIPYKKTIPKSSTFSYDESLNILRTKYAKGKVTKEQFEQKKKDLEEKYL
jgi:uncharacterized membrane protein